MKFKQILFSLAICLTVLFSLAITSLADVIKLKDGTVLKGKVVAFNQRRFTVVVKIGNTTSRHDIAADDIESIEFDGGDTIGSIAPANTQRAPQSVSTEGVLSTASTQTQQTPQTADRDRAQVPPDAQRSQSTQSEAAPATSKTSSDDLVAITEKTVSVAAAADWTSTEIRVQKGQHIVISATGTVDLGNGQRTGPEGTDNVQERLIPGRRAGALIAVIGDDNNDFEYIGSGSEIVASHNGILFLSVNDSNLRDNNGSFVAKIRVLSNR